MHDEPKRYLCDNSIGDRLVVRSCRDQMMLQIAFIIQKRLALGFSCQRTSPTESTTRVPFHYPLVVPLMRLSILMSKFGSKAQCNTQLPHSYYVSNLNNATKRFFF
jgi:hypothetical protein